MELNKRDINFQIEIYRLFGENQILLHKNNKLTKELDNLKNENKALRLQADEYFELWQTELQNKENE